MASKNQRQRAAAARAAALDGDRSELRAALEEERRGYVTRHLDDRVKQVDAQLKALGAPTGGAGDGGEQPRTRAPRGSAKSRAAKPAGGPQAPSDEGNGEPAGEPGDGAQA